MVIMKNILMLILCLISTVVNAQFFGKFIEDRVSSGAQGNYLFLLDEAYMNANEGRFPELYESGKYFLVERSEENGDFQVIDTLRPIQNRDEFEFYFRKGSIEAMLADSSGFSFDSEEELLNAYSSANNPQFGRLFFLKPLEQLRATGHAYLDTEVVKGTTYTYQVRWGDTGKVIFSGSIVAGKANPILTQTKLRFNQMSIKAIDSLITGTWLTENMSDIMPYEINYYGKKTFDTVFEKIQTKKAEYAKDTLKATLGYRVNGTEVWDVFAVPVDILGNEGTPSDTATLAAFSKGRLPFPKNFTAKDSLDGIRLTWEPVQGHSFVGGYLLSREIENQVFEVLDTLAANVRTYIDYNVESGSSYNYEIQVLSNPIGNLAIQDFPTVRVSGNHVANERLLPPDNFELSYEGEYIKVSWEKSEDPNVMEVYVHVNITGTDSTYETLGSASGNNFYIDSTDFGDFKHQTRYYALKSMGYNLKLSGFSNVKSIQPKVETVLERPIGLTVKTWADYNKLEWQTEYFSQAFIDYFSIYRKQQDSASFELLATNIKPMEYLDTTAISSQIYEYAISVTSISGNESRLSVSGQNNIRLTNPAFKPTGIAKVVGSNIPPGIQIAWLAAENNSISKINIYRMDINTEKEYRIIGEAIPDARRYWDETTEIGKTYAYAISIINENGAESMKDFMTVVERVAIEE
jgi:hypothetical protein